MDHNSNVDINHAYQKVTKSGGIGKTNSGKPYVKRSDEFERVFLQEGGAKWQSINWS